MTNRLIEYKGHKFYVSAAYNRTWFTFEDADGRTCRWTPLGMFEPEIHMRLTTIRSMVKWWIANRRRILEVADEAGYRYEVINSAERYFDVGIETFILSGTYEEYRERLTGIMLEPSLKVNFNEGNTRGGSSEFLLCRQVAPQPQEEAIPYVEIHTGYWGLLRLTKLQDEVEANPAFDIHPRWTNTHNYTYRMNESDFNWFRSDAKESSVFFGMELEISTKLSNVEIQYIVTQVEPKQEPFFIFKSDSSVSGSYRNKVELVTVPCTPRYLRKNWKILFSKIEKLVAKQGGSISDYFDTSANLNNGLHIHVSKDSFLGKPHTNKFLTAWHQWDDDAVSIIADASCRPRKYTEHSYCMPDPAYKRTADTSGRTMGIAKFERQIAQRSLARRLKGMRVENRGTAHDGNSATIEVRVYQGIFDIAHIMRSISFTEAMFEYTQSIGYQGFDSNFARTFTNFIRKNSKFKAIHNIFKYGKGETQCA
jgi:hypothetical protein